MRLDQLHLFPVGVRRNAGQMDAAFVAPVLATPTGEIRGMVRGDDVIESQRAAADVKPHTTAIQRMILTIIASEGPHTAKQLESRTEFRGLAPSTVRKRVSELAKSTNPETGKPYLVQAHDPTGVPLREDGCAVWEIQS